MARLHLRDLVRSESGLAVLEYALILMIVIIPVAVIMLAAYYGFLSAEFLEPFIDNLLFRDWRHPIGAFTYF